ncbi:1-acyl-sn-glycerol-3-phosphate acyltransferase [Paracrocinitomix mangrovi]|uniref:lysophospholipid acyltransferase family protein n=1 Tax=Paracrocinitomix mangrovi TaxID=2862509 RepID=UPI001EDADB3F|nr:lysophospholipid acyltransferase family protein [Paracrocinitomix mangrovi]UKN01809.1 1-acyl-sn-glycerol-3-phosphate acyltransferase [Paracrocinitomix mangrovi]
MMMLIGTSVKVHGLENVNPKEHYIVAANHSSYADIPALFRALPLYLRFIAKVELKKVPFLGFYMRMSGMVFIDRSNSQKSQKSIEEAGEILHAGNSVVIFPEGTTIPGEDISRFKKGVVILGKETKTTILPVKIDGTYRAWPGDSHLKMRGGKVVVSIGKPIPYEEYKDMDDLEFQNKLREIVVGLS